MQVGGGDGGGKREAGDLGEGVDAGVGAAGALGKDALADGAVDGVGEQALDGGEVGLDLPSAEGGAVVGESELPVRHGDELHGITKGEVQGSRREVRGSRLVYWAFGGRRLAMGTRMGTRLRS